ncbi:MAG: MFS transporter [bacterium]
MLKTRDMVLYSLPAAAAGYMLSLLGLYVMKYSTDVLLIAPAVMGTIFGLSRIWDALTDPMVGYLSDKTRLRFGRRRSWILVGAIPAALAYYMLFATPVDLSEGEAALWMGVAVFAFYTAMTSIMVPQLSWGAELSRDYFERNKIYGIRQAAIVVGGILGLLTVGWLTSVETKDLDAVRELAPSIAIYAGIALLVLCTLTVLTLKENTTQVVPPSRGLFGAGSDVSKNRYARILLSVTFIENIGGAAIGAAALYVAQYVMGRVEIAPYSIITYMITSTLAIPVWIRLAKRFGKIKLWFWAMIGTAVSFGGMFALAFIESGVVQVIWLMFLSVMCGIFAGCGNTIGPSVASDVIDYDELMSGERKEGVYFATWNFALKSASGVTLMFTGFVLSAAGFVPNEEQTRVVELAMCALLGLFPLVCYLIGAALFTRFDLDEAAHADIRAQLDARSAGEAVP